ncbi:hypothetical protein AYI68_g30 [Smittium mucronatum]|uniref:Uncharacterized protein n=1 Tax=Smittium mucronatum TaxID=133383 RepID=A0A1R0H9C9_9FUNG|nr:hypothetical protein AYI68_g30 [Smittium mucronatum]
MSLSYYGLYRFTKNFQILGKESRSDYQKKQILLGPPDSRFTHCNREIEINEASKSKNYKPRNDLVI